MTTPDVCAAFSASYVEARRKFIAAAAAHDAAVESVVHPEAHGADGEELAIDIAEIGPSDASASLWLLSGTHGVEGFCGSGAQVALLNDPAFIAASRESGVSVVFFHALNPYGFSHLRRTNEDNVDLNRNFRDFSAPPAANAAYVEVHDFIVPEAWPPDADTEARMMRYLATRGPAALQAAVSAGQSDRPDGLFYAGLRPAWSNDVLRASLRARARSRRRFAWIDFHTGLGPYGHAEKILSGPDDAAMLARARRWYGNDVTSFHDGSSTSAALTGVNFEAPLDECPDAEFTGIALEYGTVPMLATLQALRADQWLANHPDAPDAMRSTIKRQIRDAFYSDRDDWKGMVYGQARAAALQALRGLRESAS